MAGIKSLTFLLFQLSDQGGGIPYSKKDVLFQYMYTTAPQPLPTHSREGTAPLVCNKSKVKFSY